MKVFEVHKKVVTCMEFSPAVNSSHPVRKTAQSNSGPKAARDWVLAYQTSIHVWDVVHQTLVARFEAYEDTTMICSSHQTQKIIASCSSDSTIALWDLTAKAEIARLKDHFTPVKFILFIFRHLEGAHLSLRGRVSPVLAPRQRNSIGHADFQLS
ncbi:hypothetical protein WAI453_008455 [Rhynchosporium graminicola]